MLYKGLSDIYNISIKPMFSSKSAYLATWDMFKTFVLDVFYLGVIKTGVSLTHNWDSFLKTFNDIVLSQHSKFDTVIGFLALEWTVLEKYYVNPTFALLKALAMMPFNGINPLIGTEWVGEFAWLIGSWYTTFLRYYWLYVWDVGTTLGLKEQYYNEYYIDSQTKQKVYTGYKYPLKHYVEDKAEMLKMVDGESLAAGDGTVINSAEFVQGSSSNTLTQEVSETKSFFGKIVNKIKPVAVEPQESGRVSPAEVEASAIKNAWESDNTSQIKGKQVDISSDTESTGSEGSPTTGLPKSDEGMWKALNKYLPQQTEVSTPKPIQTNLPLTRTPVEIEGLKSMLPNTLVTGLEGVIKKDFVDKVFYYERGSVIPNLNTPGKPEISSWKWFFMYNQTFTTVLFFSCTTLTGLAIRGVIKLAANSATMILS